MKRLIICTLLTLLTAISIQAARALSEPFDVTQPDGTTLTIILHGDEYVNWLTTTDGTMVVETKQGYFVATIGDDGALQATKQLAHNVLQRSASEKQLCMQQQSRHTLFFEKAEQMVQAGRRAQINPDGGYCLHEGQPRVLIILANFSDLSFVTEDAHNVFDQLCNAETLPQFDENQNRNNLCSVRRYFQQSSHGKFNPQLDVVGPIDLPQTMEYYGASEEGSSSDAHFSQFCKDAIAAVDGEVDFNDYDNDGDGRAELVCVIYAGYGQNVSGNPKDAIWPKCSRQNITTTDASAKDESKKVIVNYMNCGAELLHVSLGNTLNGLGTFIHEFSHGMGLSDHYATVSSARVDNQTPEFWDVMDYGEHAVNGYAPVPYTAWEQETMGWLEVEQLETSQTINEMLPLLKGGKAYKFGNGADAEEWFYLENVQSRDTENQIPGFVYGHGLLVMHVAYPKSTVNMAEYPNNNAGKPGVSIVPADGLVINGYRYGPGMPYTREEYQNSLKADPFPGTGGIDHLNATMELPNYKFYHGEETPKQSLRNITENDGVVSFYFNDGTPSGIVDVRSNMKVDRGNYYDLQGRRIVQPTKGLYIVNGKKVVI